MALITDYLRGAAGNFIDAASKFGPEQVLQSTTGKKDIGFSELVGGKNNPYYGGNQSYASSAPTPMMSVNPNPNQSVAPPGGARPPVSSPAPTGGSGGSNFSPVQQSNPYDQVRAPQGPSQGEIDSQFNPVLDVYNQAESNLRGQLPGLISEAEAQARASRGLLDNSRMSSNELLGSQQQQTRQTQQSQTAQQRQTMQELQMANQQRFGGASSAGQAASELQGREFQRNTFQIGQQAQQALQQIQQQKQVVEREYNQGLQQLEVNKQAAVNQIQRQFQDKLLEINARRGETEAAKAQARMGALQELRNAAYQIDVSKAQFQAQLQMQAQQNSSYLDNAAQQFLSASNQGQEAVGSFASTTPSAIPGVQSGGQQAAPQMMGQMSRRPEEEYTGRIGYNQYLDEQGQNQSSPQTYRTYQNDLRPNEAGILSSNPLANMFSRTQPSF